MSISYPYSLKSDHTTSQESSCVQEENVVSQVAKNYIVGFYFPFQPVKLHGWKTCIFVPHVGNTCHIFFWQPTDSTSLTITVCYLIVCVQGDPFEPSGGKQIPIKAKDMSKYIVETQASTLAFFKAVFSCMPESSMGCVRQGRKDLTCALFWHCYCLKYSWFWFILAVGS